MVENRVGGRKNRVGGGKEEVGLMGEASGGGRG